MTLPFEHECLQVFMANGYPGSVVKNNLRGRTTSIITTVESETPLKLLHIPYVKGVSERIEMVKPLGVETVTSSRSTLRSLLVKVKVKPRPSIYILADVQVHGL